MSEDELIGFCFGGLCGIALVLYLVKHFCG